MNNCDYCFPVAFDDYVRGEKGDAGVGTPSGGTTGQVLVKKSNTDYDFEWQNQQSALVQSVNGQTGVVVLDADDVGALDTSDITNTVVSTATDKALSANMGKELQDQINNLKAIGRFLSLWNCATGMPTTSPTVTPYTYKTGDYFIVSAVATGGASNYKPSGTTYDGTPSTTVETGTVNVNYFYFFDGTSWNLKSSSQVEITFANIGGQPSDNSNLASALNGKQATLVSGTNIKTINNNSLLGSGDITITSGVSSVGGLTGAVGVSDGITTQNDVIGVATDGITTVINSDHCVVANAIPLSTTAPTQANNNGTFIPVVLDSEPDTYYNGYMYFIKE